MGARSGGNRDEGVREKNPDTGGWHGTIGQTWSLKEIPDAEVYRQTANAISRFHSVLGVRERNIVLAELGTAYGVHTTGMIALDKSTFSQTREQIEAQKREAYKSGWSTETNKPIAHTISHELAHALWRSDNPAANQRAAAKEIRSLYKQWMHNPSAKGYGKYATTNVDEFFAEAATKAVHGKQDKYTKRIKEIVKKYNL